jgi:hypothetical protein
VNTQGFACAPHSHYTNLLLNRSLQLRLLLWLPYLVPQQFGAGHDVLSGSAGPGVVPIQLRPHDCTCSRLPFPTMPLTQSGVGGPIRLRFGRFCHWWTARFAGRWRTGRPSREETSSRHQRNLPGVRVGTPCHWRCEAIFAKEGDERAVQGHCCCSCSLVSSWASEVAWRQSWCPSTSTRSVQSTFGGE